MTISIIVPCYQNGEFLSKCVESVMNQTYLDWELILIDDCSKDNTPTVITKLADTDARIKTLLLPENKGAGNARNKGLEVAKGNYIAFLDADDLWHENKLINQLAHMQKNNAAISHTSYSIINENDLPIPGGVKVSKKVSLLDYMKNTEIGMSTSMVDKNLVGDFRLDLVRTRQDTKLWLNLLSQGFISYGLDENLVEYRVRSGQISGNKFKMALRTLNVYWSVKTLSPVKRVFYYCHYIYNGVLKRF